MDLIRHGESTFNAQQALLGRDPQIPDAPLTERGQQQVRAAAAQLGAGAYDLIIASPYTRALHTASLLAEVIGAPILADALAGERRLYSCDIGSPLSQVRQRWADVDFSRVEQENWWLPFDETEADLMRRITAFRARWGRVQARILVATHCHFIYNATGIVPANAQLVKDGKDA